MDVTHGRVRPDRLGEVLHRGVLALVHSNLLIACSATGVAVSTAVLAGFGLEPLPLFVVFAVTLFAYSFNRLADRAEDEYNLPGRTEFVDRYGRVLFGLGTVLYLTAVGAVVVAGVPGAPALVLPPVVVVLYSVLGLKRVLLVKNLLVGLSWGLIALGMGVYHGDPTAPDVLGFTGFIVAMLTIAAAVFDIKDIEGDRAEGIATLPVVFGPRTTRLLAAGASLAVGGAVTALVLAGVVGVRHLALSGFTLYVAGYSLAATTDRTPLFYGFVVDVEHLLLAVVLLALEGLG
jgi:4-hydroxybenzoate polyprenyltransferase